MVEPSKWVEITNLNPGHSSTLIERFRTMAADGKDLVGEARFVDALVKPNSHVLDAGCGSGRIGGELAARGHRVVGVDVDPVMIEAAIEDFADPTWLVGDLAELNLAANGVTEPFDAIVSCGNVMAFLAPGTRRLVLERMASHLAADARFCARLSAILPHPLVRVDPWAVLESPTRGGSPPPSAFPSQSTAAYSSLPVNETYR